MATTIQTEATIRPPLKWAGGKRWLVPLLSEIWQQHPNCRLVEPFVGGMAVALGLMPERALLNDANEHLVNFYRQLQRGLRPRFLPFEQVDTLNTRDAFLAYRSRFNELIRQGRRKSQEAAELFYYLNRTGFNGLCRFNRKDEFNVPFGNYKRPPYLSDFSTYRQIFADWQFSLGDFARLKVQEGDFLYVDPPYDVEFTSYSKGGFGWDDQVRLGRWLAALNCPVVLSNQATPRIMALYQDLGFHVRILAAPRRIACNGDRRPAQEVLATRNLACHNSAIDVRRTAC